MHARAVATAVAIAVLLACGGARHYRYKDLPNTVLQRHEAPVGTRYVDGSSGYQTLAEFSKDDRIKRAALEQAGFVTAYFAFFLDPRLFKNPDELSGTGSLADSFALLFRTSEGASRGLDAINEAVHRDGTGLRDVPADGLGEESWGLSGTLQRGLPPGYMWAWRIGNAVFGLVAAGAEGTISENAARALCDRMLARER